MPTEDRNRTSPFPYGGGRFEFRAVGPMPADARLALSQLAGAAKIGSGMDGALTAASAVPPLPRRRGNRTGSTQNVSLVNTVLNTIAAAGFKAVADRCAGLRFRTPAAVATR